MEKLIFLYKTHIKFYLIFFKNDLSNLIDSYKSNLKFSISIFLITVVSFTIVLGVKIKIRPFDTFNNDKVVYELAAAKWDILFGFSLEIIKLLLIAYITYFILMVIVKVVLTLIKSLMQFEFTLPKNYVESYYKELAKIKKDVYKKINILIFIPFCISIIIWFIITMIKSLVLTDIFESFFKFSFFSVATALMLTSLIIRYFIHSKSNDEKYTNLFYSKNYFQMKISESIGAIIILLMMFRIFVPFFMVLVSNFFDLNLYDYLPINFIFRLEKILISLYLIYFNFDLLLLFISKTIFLRKTKGKEISVFYYAIKSVRIIISFLFLFIIDYLVFAFIEGQEIYRPEISLNKMLLAVYLAFCISLNEKDDGQFKIHRE